MTTPVLVVVPEKVCRELVRERSGGFCEIAIPSVCLGQAQSMHHRFKESQGGHWDPANILHSCGDGATGCHGWVEANPDDARLRGLWLQGRDDPATTPVLMAWRGIYQWFTLDHDGGLHWPGKRP